MQIVFTFSAVIGKDHGLLLFIEFEEQVGVKKNAQWAQEALYVSQQLCGLQQHHNDQRALCQLRWLGGAVQTVPATLLCVTALITVAILKVVIAVLIIPAKQMDR